MGGKRVGAPSLYLWVVSAAPIIFSALIFVSPQKIWKFTSIVLLIFERSISYSFCPSAIQVAHIIKMKKFL
jgi:hypothetical protein